MGRVIWINSERLKHAQGTEVVGGVEITVGVSPYDIPKTITGKYEEDDGQFIITFTYIDREPVGHPRPLGEIKIITGAHSGKVLEIHIPIDSPSLEKTAIIGLKTKVIDAIQKTAASDRETSRSRAFDVTEEILDENFEDLTEDLLSVS